MEHIRWGLGRTSRILDALGDPHRAFDVLHVAGTNGKGSVAAIASTLAASPRPVGLYTSPHLTRFAERIRIGADDAPDELLESCAARVEPLVTREGATYFEAATALAFLAFAEAGVEVAVVEVGLGGRLDATNVVSPAACAITSIALDHCETLGNTLAEVAEEKAGVLKPSVPVVLGNLPAEALAVIERRAAVIASPVWRSGEQIVADHIRVRPSGTSFRYRCPSWPDGEHLSLPLVGDHQAENAALALGLVERAGRLPERQSVAALLGGVRWPGRFERWEDASGVWILDVAHNPDGAAALARTVGALEPARPIVVVASMLARKAWRPSLAALAGITDAWVLTVAPSHEAGAAWDAAEAGAFVASLGSRSSGGVFSCVVEPRLETALRRARELAGRGTVVVAGSCHVVGDARVALDAGEAVLVRWGSRDDHRTRSDSTTKQGASDAI